MHTSRTGTAPHVSVVVTNYNHADFVAGAVRSALAQIVPPLEVVVIDDGSRDLSRDVLGALPDDPKLRIIYQENQGVVATRNCGLKEARGDWVVFLDSDDVLHPDFVARLWDAWVQRPDPSVAVVYSDARLIGASSGILRSRRYSRTALALGNYIYNCCLLRRSAVLEVGGYDPAFSRSHEDWDLFLRLVEHGYSARHVRAALFSYRRHDMESRNISTEDAYARTVELMIQRHPTTYKRWFRRRLVRRELPGLRILLAARKRGRPSLPGPRQS